MQYLAFADLTSEQRALVEEAERILPTAYNPYSHFSVGAAIRTQDGMMIAASNMENAAYGSTICAERLALGRANALGKRNLHMLAVMGRGENFEPDDNAIKGPCGACRQMIYEAAQVAGVDMQLILAVPQKTKVIVTTISELLPLPFGPRELNVNLARFRTAIETPAMVTPEGGESL